MRQQQRTPIEIDFWVFWLVSYKGSQCTRLRCLRKQFFAPVLNVALNKSSLYYRSMECVVVKKLMHFLIRVKVVLHELLASRAGAHFALFSGGSIEASKPAKLMEYGIHHS
jgi:hypothetical protein